MESIIRETIPLSEKDCFLIYSRQKEAFTFPLHVHSVCELNLIENGKGAKRVVGDSVEEIDDLDLTFIASPDLEHGWFTHDCRTKAIREITIQFQMSLFGEQLWQKNQFASIRMLFEKAKHGVTFPAEAIGRVRGQINDLSVEPTSAYSVFKLMSLFYTLSLAPVRELSQRSSQSVPITE